MYSNKKQTYQIASSSSSYHDRHNTNQVCSQSFNTWITHNSDTWSIRSTTWIKFARLPYIKTVELFACFALAVVVVVYIETTSRNETATRFTLQNWTSDTTNDMNEVAIPQRLSDTNDDCVNSLIEWTMLSDFHFLFVCFFRQRQVRSTVQELMFSFVERIEQINTNISIDTKSSKWFWHANTHWTKRQ